MALRRIVHTSDWHAGKRLGEFSRDEDLLYFLEFLKDFVKTEKVDTLLIAGDLFDKENPPLETQRMVYENLRELCQSCRVILIAGNHDSPRLLENVRILSNFSPSNLFIFPRPTPKVEQNLYQDEDLVIFALPFIDERVINSLEEGKDEYRQKVLKYLNFVAHHLREDGRFKILLSHLLVARSKISGSEKKVTLDEFYSIDPTSLPMEFDYVALGHIHKHQKVEGHRRCYYSGSPYPIDFGESDKKKFINYLILEEKGFTLEEVEVPQRRELKVLEVRSLEEAKALVKEFKSKNCLLKVKVFEKSLETCKKIEGLLSDYLHEKLVDISLNPTQEEEKREEEKSFEEKSLLEHYLDYLKKNHPYKWGDKFEEKLRQIFSNI